MTTGYDEFRRYAIETLIEGGGDCEDTTILVGAILRGLGEKTALILTPGHIALGVSGNFTGTSVTHNGTKYYYCETTGTGWTVGTLPPSSGTTVTDIVPLTHLENRTYTETQQANNTYAYTSHAVTKNNNTDTSNATDKNNA